MRRSYIRIGVISPPKIRTNVAVRGMTLGNQMLAFFPDRMLVYQRGKYAALSYEALRLSCAATRFIAGAGVPADAQVVGQTWQYPNKSGGPDRRFKNNRQLPVAKYAQVELASDHGLEVILHFSNADAADQAIRELRGALSAWRPVPSSDGNTF